MLLRWFVILCTCGVVGFNAPAWADGYEEGRAAYDAGEYETAKQILLPLARQGHAKAMNMIGLMYDFGKGFSKDTSVACNWYEKSARAGYVSGQSNVSICYRWGDGRRVNINEAIYWNEKAAEQGDLESQLILIKLLVKQNNRQKAKYWGQKAVDQGSVYAKVRMESFDLPFVGVPATTTEQLCLMIMVGAMDKPLDYCD